MTEVAPYGRWSSAAGTPRSRSRRLAAVRCHPSHQGWTESQEHHPIRTPHRCCLNNRSPRRCILASLPLRSAWHRELAIRSFLHMRDLYAQTTRIPSSINVPSRFFPITRSVRVVWSHCFAQEHMPYHYIVQSIDGAKYFHFSFILASFRFILASFRLILASLFTAVSPC